MTACSIDGCLDPIKARGWCRKHYLRWHRHGDPLVGDRVVVACAVDGCDERASRRDWCVPHYHRWWRTGDPVPAPRQVICTECEAPIYAKGLCEKHYQRQRKTGSTSLLSLEDRFWARVDRGDGCWEWRGGRNYKGYGQARQANGRGIQAHRLAYELAVGPIPEGLEIDHLCVNRGCVNPAHLEPVTHAENIRRGVARRKVG